MQNLTVFVKEATSDKPIQTLEQALSSINGLERFLVDTNDGEVKITYYENKITKKDIMEQIQEHGFHIINE